MLSDGKEEKSTAVALGYFDGVHIGHKAVLNKALSLARERNLKPVVLAFDVHPRKALHGDIPPILMSERLKREALEKMGFEVIDFDFIQAMNYSPEEFSEKILLEKLGAKVLSCGEDYRYGKDGKGTAQSLKEFLEEKGTEVITVPDVFYENEKVSSTVIRNYIQKGEIEKANGMLDFHYTYDFTVEKGDGLGRGFGFPTINQFFPQNYVVPKYGVYASQVTLDGKIYPAVTNVGTRPTVCGKDLRSETCILDYDGNLYGNNIKVSLIKYLRGEKKFSDIQELKQAIEKDIEVSRDLFKRNDMNE